jgi:hypothetical protein
MATCSVGNFPVAFSTEDNWWRELNEYSG